MTLQNFTLGTFSQGAAGGGAAFESIATVNGTGSAGTLSFTSIPQIYQHLQIRCLVRAGTDYGLYITFNSSGSGYANHSLSGNGSTASASGSSSNASVIDTSIQTASGDAANIYGVGIIDILDYSSTTKNKTVRYIGGRDKNNSTGKIALNSALWANTSAITSITFDNFDLFTTATTFALYGIKGA